MKKSATVYWLLPAKPERELFCSVIRILRKQFGTPNFEPHLTLLVTTKDRSASAKGQSNASAARTSDPKKVLQNIKARRVRLSPHGVAFSEKFTKTLFVRFKSSPALRKLVTQLARGTKSTAKAPRDLHVSLLYKKVPRAAKKELAAVIRLPLRSVVFDSIAAVRSNLPVRTGADIRKWKIVAKKSLH